MQPVNQSLRSGSSLLSWERGLKFDRAKLLIRTNVVAPLVGAWIEISKPLTYCTRASVAPLVGAWIEIVLSAALYLLSTSLLSWERGLKCLPSSVTLSLGRSLLSWERGLKFHLVKHVSQLLRRSSRGSVD